VNQQELDDLLRGVRVFNGYTRISSLLSEEQRNAIILAVLPEIQKRIAQAASAGSAT